MVRLQLPLSRPKYSVRPSSATAAPRKPPRSGGSCRDVEVSLPGKRRQDRYHHNARPIPDRSITNSLPPAKQPYQRLPQPPGSAQLLTPQAGSQAGTLPTPRGRLPRRKASMSIGSAGGRQMGRRKGIPGLSFSWKRATGLSAAKGKLSRQLGVPLTKLGRQRKAGAATGCCAPAIVLVLGTAAVAGGLLVTAGAAWAHSGGLDKNGCHTNRKTGEYHCHRAQPRTPSPAAAALTPRPVGERGRQALGPPTEVHYANCSAARAAGAAPVRRGDPGYSPKLDRDGDGVGCE